MGTDIKTYDLAHFWDLATEALAAGFLILALGSSKSGRIGQFWNKFLFLNQKFEILRSFPLFWGVAVFCSSNGSKVTVSASAHLAPQIDAQTAIHGANRRS